MAVSSVFTGSSAYSADFQQVIDRSVAIASLPIQQLNNQKNALNAQSSALAGVTATFTAIQTAIKNIDSSLSSTSVSAVSSNTAVGQATAAAGVLPGTYGLNVTSVGSYTTTVSNDGLTVVTDPSSQSISSASTFTLTINGSDKTITPSGTSLQALAAAINSQSGVRATIVNVGSGSGLDYRLSLQSTSLAADSVQLSDTGSLLNTIATGSPLVYQVNGQASSIEANSSTLTLAPGLTTTVAATGQTTISVAPATANIGASVGAFINAFNDAQGAVAAHHGQSGGALQGQNIINTLDQSLRNLTSYSTGTGSISSLASLGITFDNSGRLTVDSSLLNTAISTDLAGVQAFVGKVGGGGFLGAAGDVLTGLLDSTSGALTGDAASLTTSITNQTNAITKTQDHVDQLRASLTDQINKADAAIASLEQTLQYVTALFTAQTNSNSSR